MRKNSDFKNISYVNFEMISMMITLMSCAFISYSPIRIVEKCGSASVIGIIFICLAVYIFYSIILKAVFKNEYDIFSIIKKSYPPILQKIIGIIIYFFIILYIYLIISNLLYNIKGSIYTNSTIFSISIFFIVALYLLSKKGFNATFRIVGYVSFTIVLYIIFLFIMSINKVDINNFFPIMGNGFNDIFVNNLINTGIFVPLFFYLFFVGKVAHNKKRSVYKNFNIIMLVFKLVYAILIFCFIGTIPVEIISSRYTLLLDLSSLISLTPLSLKLTPIMIFVFSLLIFISISFCLLCGLYNIQRLNVVKDYSKYVLPSVIILLIMFLIPIPLSTYYIILTIFYILSIAITFAFPIITLIIYYIRTKGGCKKFNNNKLKEDFVEEVDLNE